MTKKILVLSVLFITLPLLLLGTSHQSIAAPSSLSGLGPGRLNLPPDREPAWIYDPAITITIGEAAGVIKHILGLKPLTVQLVKVDIK